jgi:type VI protein secretion system component VasK
MLARGSPRPPRKLIALIGAITVVPLVTLLWLGWRLLEQDHVLEGQQIQQRVERGADLVVAALQRAIAGSEQQVR